MARDVSTALASLGYRGWEVTGYNGYLNVRDDKATPNVLSFSEKYGDRESTSRAIQGPIHKCNSIYVDGVLKDRAPSERTPLHLSSARIDYWTKQDGCKKFRAYNLEDHKDFDEIIELADLNAKLIDQIPEHVLDPAHLRDPAYQVAGKYMFFKSPKTAQEAFDEEPEVSPNKNPRSTS